jgi:hypothetical protein
MYGIAASIVLSEGGRVKVPFSRTMQVWWRARQLQKDGWKFSAHRCQMIVVELPDWNRYYFPIDVRGHKILEVGSGEGECSMLYLQRGASWVYCIEPDDDAYKQLEKNAVGKPITPLHKRFELSDLNLPVDFVKVDIEGWEESLLDVEVQKPIVLEIHGLQLADKFEAKGYTIDRRVNPHGFDCTVYGYKNLEKLKK